MIIELLGPGGVGKTTVEPMVAERLGISYYHGKKRHGTHGEPVTGIRLWSGRVWEMLRRPALSIGALRTHNGSLRTRTWFAMDICRREANAATAHRAGSGVLGSGPIHALCMMSGASGADVTSLLPHLTKADVYVRLEADPAEVTRRLAGRLGPMATGLDTHGDWMAGYERAATRILDPIGLPVLVVRADEGPEVVAEQIAGRIRSLIQ